MNSPSKITKVKDFGAKAIFAVILFIAFAAPSFALTDIDMYMLVLWVP